ncbi:uncharacterized protein At4g14100-like [Diospyros lotus]|uniref:uncharacterized protein At4g14100-like n=1 Tax=Diospyros lotus TaxID=55363 RepID=UPI002256B154|nr:uncharacterized protein At4g14100-like [Diospyros lotus]
MASPAAKFIFFLSLLTRLFLFAPSLCFLAAAADPVPAPWPHQFHSILFMNRSGKLEMIDLWYDWPKGRNFNIIQHQLGKLTYDLEWNNGTSFIYTLDQNRECKVLNFEVGILRPNWLDGATYLGRRYVDGFLCNLWEKVEFIWYYEDVVSRRPVSWVFLQSGAAAHVMTFEVGSVLEDQKWQAPLYCFQKTKKESLLLESVANVGSHGGLIRGPI